MLREKQNEQQLKQLERRHELGQLDKNDNPSLALSYSYNYKLYFDNGAIAEIATDDGRILNITFPDGSYVSSLLKDMEDSYGLAVDTRIEVLKGQQVVNLIEYKNNKQWRKQWYR